MPTLFPGETLFHLKATNGLPLDFAIDSIMNTERRAIDWPGFIEAARSNGWFDFQTFETLQNTLADACVPLLHRNAIIAGFKRYVLLHPFEPRTAVELGTERKV